MIRCDPRLVRVVRECASLRRPSDPTMAQVALMLGLIARARNDDRLVPTQLGCQVVRAVLPLERDRV